MTRLRGRAARGARLVAAAPHGHWHASSFLAGLRHDRMVAPAVFDGAINGRSFRAYVERALAPALSSGDVVVLDTLGSHKVRGASLRYLPPYSPDLNPIEQAFAKLKQPIRTAAPRARETLWRSIGTMLDRFKPNECANYLANPAYPR